MNNISERVAKAICFPAMAVAVCAFASVDEESFSPDEIWAGRRAHLAVVNPAVPADDGSVLSLRGEWEFAAGGNVRCAHILGFGEETNFFGQAGVWKNVRKINVPGCWDAQGVGEPGPGIGHNYAETDHRFKSRHLGVGFYRKTVTVPESWKGKRVWLKIGRIHTRGFAWIDGEPVAQMSDAFRARKWDVTDLVTPGKPFELKIEANNAYPFRNGCISSNHRWGGLVRDVEFEATPADVYIDEAWVGCDFDKRLAEAHVEIEKVGGESRWTKDELILRVTIDDTTKQFQISDCKLQSNGSAGRSIQQSNTQTIEIPLPNFRPWSPEHPNLYTAKVEIVERAAGDGRERVLQRRYERFGVRKLEVRGEEIYLNNRPFQVHGFGDDQTYPITGVSPASKAEHLAHFMKAHAAGFNYARTHTHCELPEYFEAAEEAGILIQAELHYGGDAYMEENIEYDPIRDARGIVEACRRYVSFATLSGGNEGLLGPYAAKAIYNWMKKHDPARLVLEQDGGTFYNHYSPETSDYASGPMYMWERGTFNPRAFVCHEYANLAVKCDGRMEDDYTGVWQAPMTRAMRRENLWTAGLGEAWGDRLQDAQHDLQRFWGRRSVENARKDPFCDGYIYWTIVDFTHGDKKANTATAQGLFDPFWRAKPHGTTPESFAEVNGPTAILLDTENRTRKFGHIDHPCPAGKKFRAMRSDYASHLCCDATSCLALDETNRVYVAGEKIPAEFILSHYGDADLEDAKLVWQLDLGVRQECRTNGGEASLPRREIALGTCKAGPAKPVAKVFIDVPAVAKPVKVTLTATIVAGGAARAKNAWSFWLFPKAASSSSSPYPANGSCPDNVAIVSYGTDEVAAARKAGKNLLIVGNRKGTRDIFLGWWALHWRGYNRCPDFTQCGVATVPHPVLGDFPYEPYLSPLLFNIMGQGTPLPVLGFSEKDFVMVGESNYDFKLYLAAKTRSDGGREVFVSGLDLDDARAEAVSLRGNILAWLAAGIGR